MKKIYFLLLILFSVCSLGQNYDYTIYNTSNSGIASNYVGDIKVDANGLLWIASFSGVSTFNGTTFTKYNTGNSGIASNSIVKIQIDGLNRKWMATQSNGISRLNGTTWTNYTTSNSGLPNNTINDIAVDGLNNLWVATASGLSKFNGTTWTTYNALTNINSVATDSDNGVWVSTGNLLYKFNGTDFNIITDGVQKILRIANNTIYIDAFDGLMTYTINGGVYELYYQSTSCLAGYQLNALDVNSNNKVWIAFQGDGLQNFTDCISYTANSGLPDNYISTVRTQSNGTIWAGTLQLGLTKMTPSASTCNAPTQPYSNNITATTATLNWLPAVPAPDSYVIRYNTTNVIGGIQDATASTSISIENLNPNADYYWWVASVCGEQQSNWVLGGFFGTLQAPTCNAPTNTTVYNLGATSCIIGWTAPTSVPSNGYEVYLSTSNVAPIATTTPSYTSTTTNVNIASGLTPATSYYAWVRSNCGTAKSNWTPVLNFVTNNLSGCNAALYGQWPAANFTPACSGVTEQIVVNAYASEFTNVNIVANRQYTFSSSVSTDFITITNDSNVILASGTTPLSWSSQSTTGVIRYYLHANANCGAQNTDRIRYIQCTTSTSCGLPTNLAVSNITSNSCRLTWNAPTPAASSYDIYIITSNTAPIATTTATQTSNGNIVGSLNGLLASTTYYYWVRSNCNGTRSAWVSGGSFTTIAALNCNGAIYGLYPEATFTPTCSPSSEQIATDAWAGEYSNVNVSSNHQYTFASSIATDYITITNASGTAVLASGTSPLVWNSGATAGVVRYHLNTNANCGVQNSGRTKFIQCTASSSCGLPTNLAVSNITSNSCRFTWNAPTPAATTYEIYVATTTTAPISTTNQTAGSMSTQLAVLGGLTASTTYYYWIRSNCNGTKSDWVAGGSFTTVAFSNCNGASYGLFPEATFTPNCSGQTEQIVTNAWAGEFTNVNIQSNKQYTFTSSIATDYITITNATGTTVFASGVTPLVWNSNVTTGLIRYYLHTNANCGVQNTARVRSITCANVSSCNPPTNFGSEVLSSTSAVIGWIPSISAPNGGYLYVYNTTPTIGGMDGSTGSTSADLTDLLPNTTYYWWVSSDCVSSQSDWAYGGSFTTPGTATSCWQTISAGYTHSVGIKTDGTLWAWGDNGYGQLGDGTIISKNTPTQIGSANNWESVSASGGFTIAIKANGTLWAWGNNAFGQLGDGTTTNRTTPTQIGTATNWNSVTVGEGFALAVKDNGTLWSWGYNNYGQLGDGTTANRTVPTQVGTATNWQSTAAGAGFSLAIRTNGTLWAWGYNNSGQLGDGTTTNRITPLQIGTENDWANVAAGYAHSVGLKTNGILYTWGNNANGQLGDSTTTNKLTPTGVYDQVESIEAGWYYTVGTTTFGNMLICGQNNFGQLGDSTTSDRIWVSATNSTDHLQISAGAFHTLSLHTDGSLKVCGLNGQGRLGDGTTTDRISLTPLACPTNNLGIGDFTETNTVKVYPNPVNDILNISFEQGISSVSIYNLLGQEVFTKSINANETTIDVSNFAAGTYLVKVQVDNEVQTLKVIKK